MNDDATDLPAGATLLLGIGAEHDDPEAQQLLDDLVAWLMAYPKMPLLASRMGSDCLVAPPERGGGHFEVMWVVV